MKAIEASMDGWPYSTKPTQSEMRGINNRLADGIVEIDWQKVDIKEFAKSIGNNGYAWCPCTFKDKLRRSSHFKQIQFLALDFDNGITWEEVLERAKRYNLPILFAYETYSSENLNRFRVVFLNDVSITDIRVAKVMLTALLMIFPEADPQCKDVVHMYLGGKNLFYFDISPFSIPTINIESLILNMTLYLRDNYGDTHYGRKIQEFANTTGLGSDGKSTLDVFVCYGDDYLRNGKISHSSVIYIIEDSENLPKHYVLNFYKTKKIARNIPDGQVDVKKKSHKSYSNTKMIDEIRKRCMLFNKFENGEDWLYHEELYGIATNLIQVDGGKTCFLDILANNPQHESYERKRHEFREYIRYWTKHEYSPTNCDKYCRYKHECLHGPNVMETVSVKPNKTTKLVNYGRQYYPLDEVYADVKEKILTALGANDKKIHIIRAQTAIGKTRIILEYLKTSKRPCLICVPYNFLKNELLADALAMGIPIMVTPSLDEIPDSEIPEKIRNVIASKYKCGRHREVIPYIKSELTRLRSEGKDIPALRDFLEKREAAMNFAGHIITTHQKLRHSSREFLEKYNIIVDEDILKSTLTNAVEIDISDLKDTLDKITCKKGLEALADKIRMAIEYAETINSFDLPTVQKTKRTASISAPFDILAFCETAQFCYDKFKKQVSFLKICPLYDDLKYTIMSATADEEIYKRVYGDDRVVFYDCKQAKYMGKLIQYGNMSMSRTDIDAVGGKIFDMIWEKHGKLPTITHKKYFENDPDYPLHLCNAEGSNIYKGKDIIVAGTPHQNEIVYKRIAQRLVLNVNDKMKYQKVTYNGYSFWFYAYTDENMRHLQFWLINSFLEQSIGRNRLLREPCIAYVYSNFPLEQSILEESEFENHIKRAQIIEPVYEGPL